MPDIGPGDTVRFKDSEKEFAITLHSQLPDEFTVMHTVGRGEYAIPSDDICRLIPCRKLEVVRKATSKEGSAAKETIVKSISADESILAQIGVERMRQIQLGHTPERDDTMKYNELVYGRRQSAASRLSRIDVRPENRRHLLIEAAAMIVAEIGRLDRLGAKNAELDRKAKILAKAMWALQETESWDSAFEGRLGEQLQTRTSFYIDSARKALEKFDAESSMEG